MKYAFVKEAQMEIIFILKPTKRSSIDDNKQDISSLENNIRIPAHELETMEAAFNVTGERRKALVEAVKAFIDAPAIYQNAPSFAYVIGDYTVSKTGTVSGPANEALMAALNSKGFVAE